MLGARVVPGFACGLLELGLCVVVHLFCFVVLRLLYYVFVFSVLFSLGTRLNLNAI